MKKLLSVLLCALLLCASVFSASAAQGTVQDVFESKTDYPYDTLTLEGDYFTLCINVVPDRGAPADNYGFLLYYYDIGIDVLKYASIEAKAGYIIDEVIFPVSFYTEGTDIIFSSGTPSGLSGSEDWGGTIIDIKDINSTSFEIARGDYIRTVNYLQSKCVTVIGHKDVPSTGDNTQLPLLLAVALLSTGVLTAAVIRRRREF